MFFNYRKKCELCEKEHKDNCDFGSDERQKLKQICSLVGNRDLILVAHWRNQPQANISLIEKPTVVEIDKSGGF